MSWGVERFGIRRAIHAPLQLSITCSRRAERPLLLLAQAAPLCRVPYSPAQMTGCRARLEMVDGPRGCFGRLTLAGPTEAVGYAQWLLGQRLSAAASFQVSAWPPAGLTLRPHMPHCAGRMPCIAELQGLTCTAVRR